VLGGFQKEDFHLPKTLLHSLMMMMMALWSTLSHLGTVMLLHDKDEINIYFFCSFLFKHLQVILVKTEALMSIKKKIK
jgi:hypothetical protein